MTELSAARRAKLPDSAFAYIDAKGGRRLPINDEAHTRNALARFGRVVFEDDAARERARRRLLRAARKYGIVPIGFMTGQIERERDRGRIEAAAGEIGRLPKGAVTFLLADIEGSTALVRGLGDGYGRLLEDVRAILRRAVTSAGGYVVDARADELFAVFKETAEAVAAALESQRALARATWPAGVEVRVRMGIHSGRPTLTATGYVGIAVHTASRICSSAHGGQVVVSPSARDALLKSVPQGIDFRDLGPHQLHGLADPLELFQLLAPDLATGFPPLRLFLTPTTSGGGRDAPV